MTLLSLPKRRRPAGLLLVLFALGITRLPADQPLPEDLLPELKVILQQAMAQSPQMILRNLDIATNEGNYLGARAQMLPGVSAGASYNVSGAAVSSNTNVSSTSSGLYYSLSISQPLFRWGTLKAQLDAASIQREISRKNYAEAYRTLALSLRSQYLGLMTKKLASANAQYAQRQTAAILALEEDKLRNGQTSESQVLQLRLQVEEASLQAERVAEDLAQSKRLFQRQAGLVELSDDRIPTELPAVSFDPGMTNAMLQRFLAREWEDNLNVQINRNWVKFGELNYKVTKYRLFPMFSLAASVSQSNSTNASLNSVSQVSVLSEYVGVSASWSIFDGFATAGARISAQAAKRTYERQLQTVTDQLLDQAMNQARLVDFAYRAMHLAQMRASISESALRSLRDDAEHGLVSRASVDAAVGADNQTRLMLLIQSTEYLSRWSEFVSTVGHDPVLQQLPASTHAR